MREGNNYTASLAADIECKLCKERMDSTMVLS